MTYSSTRGLPRRPGKEIQAAAWLVRHPGYALAPAALGLGLVDLGPTDMAGLLGGVAGAGVLWWRTHPDSFDRWAAPRLRAYRRRWWGRYRGHAWKRMCQACGLVVENYHTDQIWYPRVLRVASPSPLIDRVTVKLPPGQSLRMWEDMRDEIAATLHADHLAIGRVKPHILTLTVVHGNPFARALPAAPIPEEASAVDLAAIELGMTEHGRTWCEPLIRHTWLVIGNQGTGKSSIMWNTLRQLGPAIREGLVRVWMIDPKGGMETRQSRQLFYRWADHVDDPEDEEDEGQTLPPPAYAGESALTVVKDYLAAMRHRQSVLAERGIRKVAPSTEFPLDVLIIDEFAMLTAFSSRLSQRQLTAWLGEILTQGRACACPVMAFAQEPTKDIVPLRDLFTRRIALALMSADYVDMVLGDGAWMRGALADEIPIDEDHAGTAYRVDEHSRTPMRVRAGHTTDADIHQLLAECTPPDTATPNLHLVA